MVGGWDKWAEVDGRELMDRWMDCSDGFQYRMDMDGSQEFDMRRCD